MLALLMNNVFSGIIPMLGATVDTYRTRTVNESSLPFNFNTPRGICSNNNGIIYIVESRRVLKMENHTVSVLAGSIDSGDALGQGTEARFDHSRGCACDTEGNIYIGRK